MQQYVTKIDPTSWKRAAQFYGEKSQRFVYEPLTPTTLINLKRFLIDLQKHQQMAESHNVWKIPLKLVYNQQGQMAILPDLAKSLIGIEGLDAANTGRRADEKEMEIS
jgi:hypothetical protein